MPTKTGLAPLAVSALALLLERPMHTYEMQQMLVRRNEDRNVKISFGSLYRAVDRLAALGYVQATGTDREGNRPERTTYAITAEGERIFTEKVAEIIARPVNEYPEFPLGLGHAHYLPLRTVIGLLRKRVLLLRAEVTVIEGSIDVLREIELPAKYWLDKRYLREVISAEISTLKALIDDLTTGVIQWDISASESE